MAQAAAVEYLIRRYLPEDEARVLALLRQSLGETETLQRTSQMWRWKHEDNPFGASHVLVAVPDSGEVVGLRAFMRWGFWRAGAPVSAVRAVDTATHPEYQRMGLFSRLTRQAVQEIRSQGIELIFNTPNQRVLPGYLKLGWQQVGRVEPLVRVLSYPRFALGLASYRLGRRHDGVYAPQAFFRREAPAAASALARDGRLGELLERDARLWRDTLHTHRSVEYIHWRYASHPTIPYWAVTRERGGTVEACAVFRTNTRFGLKEVVLSEMLLSHSNPKLVRELLHQLRSYLQADYLIAYFPRGSFHRWALEHQGFHRVPGQGMTLVANPLAAPLGELADLESWGLGLGDLEFF